MAVSVHAQGDTFVAGRPVPLFEQPDGISFFDVTEDGQRFLQMEPAARTPSQMTVIVNWQAGLTK
jgi:hypothetical protein